MNAALNAPSAKIARKWFGSRSATKNASATGPAPSTAASMMSRRKPVTRDSSVIPPTVRMRSIMLIGCLSLALPPQSIRGAGASLAIASGFWNSAPA